MPRDVHQWQLFLDESGVFVDDDATEIACIAGFMLHDDAPRGLEANLREMIRVAVPLAPYPLHTSHANQPAYWLAAWQRGASAQREAFARLDPVAASRLPGWYATAEGLALRAEARPFFDALAAASFPDYDALRDLSVLLRNEAPEVASGLDAVVRAFRVRVGEMIDRLAERYTERRCHFVGAVWQPAFDPAGALAGSHYLHALAALFERIFAVLRGEHRGRHQVLAHVARLGIEHPVLSTGRRRLLLRSSDVADAIRHAERFPLAPPDDPARAPVRIVPDQPGAYGPTVHPGIVLADHLSNVLWNAVRGAGDALPWNSLADLLVTRIAGGTRRGPRPHDAVLGFQAPVRATPEPRSLAPMVAVTGTAQALIRHAWTRPKLTSLDPGAVADVRPRWARDQLERWVALASQVAP